MTYYLGETQVHQIYCRFTKVYYNVDLNNMCIFKCMYTYVHTYICIYFICMHLFMLSAYVCTYSLNILSYIHIKSPLKILFNYKGKAYISFLYFFLSWMSLKTHAFFSRKIRRPDYFNISMLSHWNIYIKAFQLPIQKPNF